MGGRGASFNSNQAGIKAALKVRQELNRSLPIGADHINVLNIGPVNEEGLAAVEYEIVYRTPYQETDSDGYTYTVWEEESEYRTSIRKVR